MIKKATNRFTAELEPIPQITGDFQKLEQVIINLIQNSCQSLSNRDSSIKISTHFDEKQEVVTVKVSDQGVGIPAQDLAKIKDPFFTTKRESGGTGLGLSVSSAIVADHGGSLEYVSRVGEGTTARVFLPAKEE